MGVGAGLYMCDFVVKKFTFAISSPDEFLYDMKYTRRTLSYENRKINSEDFQTFVKTRFQLRF